MKTWFYTITQEMAELGLRGTDLILFGVINGYSQEGDDGCCYATRRSLARRCGVNSLVTIDSALRRLLDGGYIEKFKIMKNDRELVAYSISSKIVQGVQNLNTPHTKNGGEGIQNLNTRKSNNKTKSKTTYVVDNPPTLDEVIAYVKTLKMYKPDDPEGFARYYFEEQSERGWVKGDGTKVTDWKCNVRVWAKNHLHDKFPTPKAAVATPNVFISINDYITQ